MTFPSGLIQVLRCAIRRVMVTASSLEKISRLVNSWSDVTVSIPRDQYHRLDFVNQHLGGYFFSWPKTEGDQAAVVFGFGSIYNHSEDPNANWETDVDRGVYVFTALKNIAADDEICVSYGKRWWEARRYTVAEEGAR